MIYGWEIIVFLIIVGGFFVYGYAKFHLPEKCLFPLHSELYCNSIELNTANNITINIRNLNRYSITTSPDSQLIWKDKSCNAIEGVTIQSEANGNITFRTGINCPAILAKGSRIVGDIKLKYRDDSGFPEQATGTLVAQMP